MKKEQGTGTGGDGVKDEWIWQKILHLRGLNVMLDRDLAFLYGVTARRLREQVKRNKDRFPGHFMFQLAENEIDEMVSHFATPSGLPLLSSRKQLGGSLPYAFTEFGILMLANVLKSERAVAVSIRLVEIFVRMRQLFQLNQEMKNHLKDLEKRVGNHDEHFKVIYHALKSLSQEPPLPRRRIGYRRASEND